MFPLTEQEKSELLEEIENLYARLDEAGNAMESTISMLNARAIKLDEKIANELRAKSDKIGAITFQLSMAQYKNRNSIDRVFTIDESGPDMPNW